MKCAVIAIIGPTNAGKSSLINSFIGTKLSIVTHKVQTTRSIIRGIVNHNDTQLIFLDTPGIFIPKRSLERLMARTAWRGSSDAEITLLVVDSKKGITNNVRTIIKKTNNPVILVLNKIDLVKKEDLLILSTELNSLFPFTSTFMISAVKNNGTNDIKNYLAKIAPECPWLYPEGQTTDAPLKFTLAEITREKLFIRVHQELPYQLIVETEMMKEGGDNNLAVYQIIYVNSENHKKIIFGKNKSTLESIKYSATLEMNRRLEKNVILNLLVKVKKEWINNDRILSNIGYETV